MLVGGEWIPGARRALVQLSRRGHPIVYVSNGLYWAEDVASQLTDAGVPTQIESIIHVPRVLAEYLLEHFDGAAVYVIGEPSLIDQLPASIRLSCDPDEIEVVVVSADLGFDFSKLTVAFRALERGARLLTTNIERTWPGPSGLLPDTRAILGALHGCTGRVPEAVVGKPSTWMAQTALKQLGLPPRDVWVVGDSLETDVRMGAQIGMRTALVLTGVTARSQLIESPLQPDHVLESLAELPALLDADPD